jgi:hypothetical protein
MQTKQVARVIGSQHSLPGAAIEHAKSRYADAQTAQDLFRPNRRCFAGRG